jgi:hypothetical protein
MVSTQESTNRVRTVAQFSASFEMAPALQILHQGTNRAMVDFVNILRTYLPASQNKLYHRS